MGSCFTSHGLSQRRGFNDVSVTKNQIEAIKDWLKSKKSKTEIAYRPARVLLQDYTGIPAVADLAAMRDAVKSKKKDQKKINYAVSCRTWIRSGIYLCFHGRNEFGLGRKNP